MGEGHAAFDVGGRLGEYLLVDGIPHHQSGDFESAEDLDAAAKHRREVVCDAGKKYLAVNTAYCGHLKPRAREYFSSMCGAREPEEKDASCRKEYQDKEDIARHELREPDDYLRVDRKRLSDLLEHPRELRNDERHHECHDHHERRHNERGIHEGVARFLGQFEISVQVLGEEREARREECRLLGRVDAGYDEAAPLQGGDGDIHVERVNGALPLIAFRIKGSVGEDGHTLEKFLQYIRIQRVL